MKHVKKRMSFNVKCVLHVVTRSTSSYFLFVVKKLGTSFDSLTKLAYVEQHHVLCWMYTDSAATCFVSDVH